MGCRVFMLEDDPNINGFVRDLAGDQGWEFLCAERVKDAYPAIVRFRPDIILLDVNLPDGNGYEALAELRRDPVYAQTPVIFLTSHGDVQSRVKGFAAGGQDYLSKPFAIQELLARMRAHLAIKERQDALARRVEELTLRDRVRRDVADMVVHDLRDQLGSIQITLELVRQSGLISDSRYATFLKSAEATSEFMLLMVNDLLDLSSEKLRVDAAPLDLEALFKRLRGLFTPQMERRKVALRLPAIPRLDGFATDGTLVFRILANLVGNAAKFSRAGQEVAVDVRVAPPGLRLEVLDQGPGVPESEKQNIFLKWHRADTPESRAATGSGIGLSFCRLAVDGIGGKISVDNRESGGSRFVVEIPPLSPGPKK